MSPFIYVGLVIVVVGISIFMAKRSQSQHGANTEAMGSEVEAVRAYCRSISQGEPVCVIAYEAKKSSPIVVGLTEERVLIKPFGDQVHEFQYDHEGEHLPEAEKNAQNRGLFQWKFSEDVWPDQKIYAPVVKKNGGQFAGQVWYFFPEIQGFPSQHENMLKFARAFYFQWFY